MVHGVAAWFEVAMEGPQQTVVLSTSPSAEWTHWWQTRMVLREPLGVNVGQQIDGQCQMVNNDRMSNDVIIQLELPGTNIERK